jgi:hypothetical protein
MFEKRLKAYRARGYETREEGARLPLFLADDVTHPDL